MPYNYSVEERIMWLKNMNPCFNSKNWHDDQVFHPSQITYLQFFKRISTSIELIDPSKISGIDYFGSYNSHNKNYTWINFFTDLKRLDWVIDNFNNLEQVTNHIHNAKEGKTVLQFGKHYFTIQGQHRLCLSKFLNIPEVKVTVIKHVLDRVWFIREMRFNRLIPELKKQNFISNSYKKDSYIDFVLINIGNNSVFIKKRLIKYLLDRDKILKKMPFLGLINYLKAILLDIHIREHIDDDSMLYLLDYFLLKRILTKTN